MLLEILSCGHQLTIIRGIDKPIEEFFKGILEWIPL